MSYFEALPKNAIGLALYKIVRDELIGCEPVFFEGGRAAVDTILRRAALSGRVEIEGKIEDHFVDVLTDENGTWELCIALDRKSYNILKNKWMRCKIERLS